MMRIKVTVLGGALALLLWSPLAGPATLHAQVTGPGPYGRWPLQPQAPMGRTLAPFLEGWYENEDGSYSMSFGYLNANEDTLDIPIGEDNFIEPAEYNGMQPTVFYAGHNRGVFAVTLPRVLKDTDVWWTLRKPNGETTRVPGRTNSNAYQLDWYPRPHGTVPPRVSFEGGSDEGRGPPGIVASRTLSTTVGSALTLAVNVREISERDRTDFRFFEPLTLRIVWSVYQAPVGGRVVFTRHESTPIPEEDEGAARGGGGGGGGRFNQEPPGPETIMVPDDEPHTVRVVATFSQPGEYLMRARVDNFRAPDSSDGDQCCWTNGYIRVNVR